jgi:hypothetical protein
MFDILTAYQKMFQQKNLSFCLAVLYTHNVSSVHFLYVETFKNSCKIWIRGEPSVESSIFGFYVTVGCLSASIWIAEQSIDFLYVPLLHM